MKISGSSIRGNVGLWAYNPPKDAFAARFTGLIAWMGKPQDRNDFWCLHFGIGLHWIVFGVSVNGRIKEAR